MDKTVPTHTGASAWRSRSEESGPPHNLDQPAGRRITVQYSKVHNHRLTKSCRNGSPSSHRLWLDQQYCRRRRVAASPVAARHNVIRSPSVQDCLLVAVGFASTSLLFPSLGAFCPLVARRELRHPLPCSFPFVPLSPSHHGLLLPLRPSILLPFFHPPGFFHPL